MLYFIIIHYLLVLAEAGYIILKMINKSNYK